MDILTISEWLKNTVPGIIFLGVVGSILSSALIWLANRLLLPVLRGYLGFLLKALIGHFVNPAVRQLVKLHFLPSENKIQLFCSLQIMKVALALFVSLCAFGLFLFSLSISESPLFRISVLGPLVIFFLGLWYSLRCIAIVMVPMYFDIEGEIHRAKGEFGVRQGLKANVYHATK